MSMFFLLANLLQFAPYLAQTKSNHCKVEIDDRIYKNTIKTRFWLKTGTFLYLACRFSQTKVVFRCEEIDFKPTLTKTSECPYPICEKIGNAVSYECTDGDCEKKVSKEFDVNFNHTLIIPRIAKIACKPNGTVKMEYSYA
ncbi:hypothetical protein MHBO_001078 [Bonamia ostreae]|uniref:Uncharacterized protein n=1 Tax=Bonamia ostreae TaxID=126728 RepID=A0ABV2AHR6_9EUKA